MPKTVPNFVVCAYCLGGGPGTLPSPSKRARPGVPRPACCRAPLVCFPPASGSASYFFPVSKALAKTADVLASQYPGRQDRRTERCIDNVAELAASVTGVLQPWLDRPTVLFGHSLGATVGFEVARR